MALVASIYHLPPRVLPSIHAVEGGWPGAAMRNTNGSEDLGVMQVNTLWIEPLVHYTGLPAPVVRQKLISLPCFNIAAAGAILRGYLDEARGDLMQAIGYYHSHRQAFSLPYQVRVREAAASLFTRATPSPGKSSEARRTDRARTGLVRTAAPGLLRGAGGPACRAAHCSRRKFRRTRLLGSSEPDRRSPFTRSGTMAALGSCRRRSSVSARASRWSCTYVRGDQHQQFGASPGRCSGCRRAGAQDRHVLQPRAVPEFVRSEMLSRIRPGQANRLAVLDDDARGARCVARNVGELMPLGLLAFEVFTSLTFLRDVERDKAAAVDARASRSGRRRSAGSSTEFTTGAPLVIVLVAMCWLRIGDQIAHFAAAPA